MADAELHIIVKSAGDPEALGALLKAAITLKEQERPTKTVIPNGYRCCECYRDDGSHDPLCSFRMAELRGTAHEPTEQELAPIHAPADAIPASVR